MFKTKIKPSHHVIVSDREILTYILNNSKYRKILIEQSYKTFTTENIEFLLEVDKLNKMNSKKEIHNQIFRIYNRFIETEILNIQSSENQQIRKSLKNTFDREFFSKAYNNIFRLVINNDINILKRSTIYPELVKEIINSKNKSMFFFNLRMRFFNNNQRFFNNNRVRSFSE